MKARTIVGVVCVLGVLAVALDAATGTLNATYKGSWSDSAGTVTYREDLTGVIIANNRQINGQYAWQDLGGGQTRVYGSYTCIATAQGDTFSGTYSIVLQGPVGAARPIVSSTVSIASGVGKYAAITDNNQPGTATGSFSATNVPTQLDFAFASVTY